MKTTHTILLAIFSFLLLHTVTSPSPLQTHQELLQLQVHPRHRNQPRRLLLASAVASFSSNPKNPSSSKAMEDPKKSVEASLRKSPPSKSNPTQNR